jgi:hypothetical protein
MSDDGWESDDESVKKRKNMDDIILLKKELQYLKKTIEDKLESFEELISEDETIPDGWVKKAQFGRIYYKNLITGEREYEKPQTSSKQIINSPWGEIKYGMNQEEVLKILGYPKHRLCYGGYEFWRYRTHYNRDEKTIYRGDIVFSVSKWIDKPPEGYLSQWYEPL